MKKIINTKKSLDANIIDKIPANILIIDKDWKILRISKFMQDNDIYKNIISHQNFDKFLKNKIKISELLQEDKKTFIFLENDIIEATLIAREIGNNSYILKIEDVSKSVKSMNKFMENLSKEIKTPINVILGIVSLLGDMKDCKEYNQYKNILEESSFSLMKIVNDVVDYSKLESGTLLLRTSPFYISDCIISAQNIVKSKAIDKGIKMKFKILKSNDYYFLGDSNRIQQILVNLYSNSIKFTENGGYIETEASEVISDGDVYIQFSVKDTGPGIDDKNTDLLFKSFNQLYYDYSIDNKKTQGYGLGLAICKKLCKLMNGDIWLDKTNLIGTKMCFLVKVKTSDTKEYMNNILSNTLLNDKHIMIIIEDKDIRISISKILSKYSMIPYFCSNIEECMILLDTAIKFSIIFIDNKHHKIINSVCKKTDTPVVSMSSVGGDFFKGATNHYNLLLTSPLKEEDIISLCKSIINKSINYENKISDVLIYFNNTTNTTILTSIFKKLGIEEDNITITTSMIEAKRKIFTNNYDIFILELGYKFIEDLLFLNCVNKNISDKPFIVGVTIENYDVDLEIKSIIDEVICYPLNIEKIKDIVSKTKVKKINI
jgi:signal transduction histidine kinase